LASGGVFERDGNLPRQFLRNRFISEKSTNTFAKIGQGLFESVADTEGAEVLWQPYCLNPPRESVRCRIRVRCRGSSRISYRTWIVVIWRLSLQLHDAKRTQSPPPQSATEACMAGRLGMPA